MIRKIQISQLQPGMYVVDLHRSWLEHRFWRSRFLVPDQECIRRIAASGIREISIDTTQGINAGPEFGINTRINQIEQRFLSAAEQVRSCPLYTSRCV